MLEPTTVRFSPTWSEFPGLSGVPPMEPIRGSDHAMVSNMFGRHQATRMNLDSSASRAVHLDYLEKLRTWALWKGGPMGSAATTYKVGHFAPTFDDTSLHTRTYHFTSTPIPDDNLHQKHKIDFYPRRRQHLHGPSH